MILIASEAKRPVYTPKGVLSRKSVLEMYKGEIDELYSRVDNAVTTSSVLPPQSWEEKDLSKWLVEQATELLENKEVKADVDLFDQGMNR
jgi:hypothetical protein